MASMNHHKHHRINTEEYQRELRELFAQKPALMKSLKTLVGELERLKKSEEFANLTPDDLLNKDVIQRIAKKRVNSNQTEKEQIDSYVENAMQKALLNTFHDPQYPEKLDMAWSNFPSVSARIELKISPRNWLTKTPDGQYDIDTEKLAQSPRTISSIKNFIDMSPENADKIIKKVGQSNVNGNIKNAVFRNFGKFASLETLLNKQIVPADIAYDTIKDKTKDFTEHPISLEKLKELHNTHHADDTSYTGRAFKDYVLSHPDTPKEEILDNIKKEADVSPQILTHGSLSPEDVRHAVKLRLANQNGFLSNQSFIDLNTKEKVDKGLAALDGLHDYIKDKPDVHYVLKDYGAHLMSMALKGPDDVREYAFHKLLERYNNKDYLSNDPNTASAIRTNLAHGVTNLISIDSPSSQKVLNEIAKGTYSIKDKSGKIKENNLLDNILNRYRFRMERSQDFVNEMRRHIIESGHMPSVKNLYKKWDSAEHPDKQKAELDHIINKLGVEKAAQIIPHMGDVFLKRDVFSNPELSQKIMPHLSPAAKAHLQKRGVFPGGVSKHDSPLKFASNTEILRKLRDVAEANGGSISAKQLAQHGLNENALKVTHLKDAKGNYTKEAIQSYIDSMPKHMYDYSHTRWNDAQMHSDEKQYVFQLNHNDDILKEMQDAGVYDTFAKAHELSFNSSHPVKKNTLGWVRYTKGKDGNIHIDEVQSDLGRSLHGSIKEYLENKPDSPQKRKMEELFSKEKIDKMNDILFKGQHPSKILHEGFLQFLRDNGNVGKDVHIWQAMPKAKLAGQKIFKEVRSSDLPDVIAFHKKIEANEPIDEFYEAEAAARATIGPIESNELYKKHGVFTEGTSIKGPERVGFNLEGYKNDIVNHPMYKLTTNYLKAHKTGDTLESALEHPNIKDKDVRIPYTLNELPVHMKVGYHETPIKMGYEADSYGKIETQKNDNLANQPTWKQPLRKSLKALTAEYERLLKVQFVNGTHYPESTDRVGTPHPTLGHLIVHKARNGKHVWSYCPELSRVHDRNLTQLMGGQKISTRSNTPLPNKITSLQKPTASAVRGFAADLLNNPDRHVMSANTDPTKPAHHAEMRVRHLINALTGSEGYEIKDHPEGFEVYAPRHSKSSKADDIATRWIYNASKKELRSERIYPTSPDGGNGNGKRFGKSVRPRASSNLRRRHADERIFAVARPRSAENSMGKAEVDSRLLKAEDEAGMTAYPLKDGYSLHHETSQNGYDIWAIGHNGQRAGTFMVCTDEGRRGRPFVSWAGVEKPHRGKGIGAAVYKTLAVHYGGLDSDKNSTSVDAIKAWRRAGGKQLKIKTQFGDFRYTLDGDKKKPPIVWNEEPLEKDIPQAKFTKLLPANQRPEQDVKRIEQGKIAEGKDNYTPSEQVAEKQLRPAYGYKHTGAYDIINNIRQSPTTSGIHDPYSAFLNSEIKRGITIASTKTSPSVAAHEAHHKTVTKLINKYGEDKVHNLYNKVVDNVPQNLKNLITNILRTYPSYKALHESSHPRHQLAFKEELVNFIRDMATDGGTEGRRHQIKELYQKRNNYQPNAVGMETFEKFDNLIKKTWKDIHTFANNATEKHLE